jgi:hypothetical protein
MWSCAEANFGERTTRSTGTCSSVRSLILEVYDLQNGIEDLDSECCNKNHVRFVRFATPPELNAGRRVPPKISCAPDEQADRRITFISIPQPLHVGCMPVHKCHARKCRRMIDDAT